MGGLVAPKSPTAGPSTVRVPTRYGVREDPVRRIDGDWVRGRPREKSWRGGDPPHHYTGEAEIEPRGDMARDPLRAVVRHLIAVGGRPALDPTDQELLERF